MDKACEPLNGRGFLSEATNDNVRGSPRPAFQNSRFQGGDVCEVPVETAARYAKRLGERLRAQRRIAIFGQHLGCMLDPVGAAQGLAHDPPYTCVLTEAKSCFTIHICMEVNMHDLALIIAGVIGSVTAIIHGVLTHRLMTVPLLVFENVTTKSFSRMKRVQTGLKLDFTSENWISGREKWILL